MKKFLTLSVGAALVAGFANLGQAQEPTATPTDAQRAHLKEVSEREMNQKKRIEGGEKSGELTESERHGLQKDEDRVQEKKKEYEEKNGGHITKKEQRSLNESEDKIGKDINADKHNDAKASSEEKEREDKRIHEEKKHAEEKSRDGDKSQ